MSCLPCHSLHEVKSVSRMSCLSCDSFSPTNTWSIVSLLCHSLSLTNTWSVASFQNELPPLSQFSWCIVSVQIELPPLSQFTWILWQRMMHYIWYIEFNGKFFMVVVLNELNIGYLLFTVGSFDALIPWHHFFGCGLWERRHCYQTGQSWGRFI